MPSIDIVCFSTSFVLYLFRIGDQIKTCHLDVEQGNRPPAGRALCWLTARKKRENRNGAACLRWFSSMRGSVPSHIQFSPHSGSAQSVFTNRICSTDSHLVSRKRGAPNTNARPLARETATLIRLSENRKSKPRGVSSAEDAVMETRQTGAS